MNYSFMTKVEYLIKKFNMCYFSYNKPYKQPNILFKID